MHFSAVRGVRVIIRETLWDVISSLGAPSALAHAALLLYLAGVISEIKAVHCKYG